MGCPGNPGTPKCLRKKLGIPKRNLEGTGVEHFEISKGEGGLKCLCPPVVGYEYFLVSPNVKG